MIDIEKMSRKETIRALRACGHMEADCAECPLGESPAVTCFDDLMQHAADVLEASVSVQYE